MKLLTDWEIQDAVVVAMYKDGKLFPPRKDDYVVTPEDKAIAQAQLDADMEDLQTRGEK